MNSPVSRFKVKIISYGFPKLSIMIEARVVVEELY